MICVFSFRGGADCEEHKEGGDQTKDEPWRTPQRLQQWQQWDCEQWEQWKFQWRFQWKLQWELQ